MESRHRALVGVADGSQMSAVGCGQISEKNGDVCIASALEVCGSMGDVALDADTTH